MLWDKKWCVVMDGSGWAADKVFSLLTESGGGFFAANRWSFRHLLAKNIVYSYLGLFSTLDKLIVWALQKRVIINIFHVNFQDKESVKALHRVIGCSRVRKIVVPNHSLVIALVAMGVVDRKIEVIPIPLAARYLT
ncbi:MAG: hypothetical protein VXZ77_04095 [Pseudomonadota bacterium]|nr:hypothetical protein [Pseudomonadota bacterium]